MSPFVRKVIFLDSFLCLAGFTAVASAQAHDAPLQFNIPAGSLANGLDRLGDESGVQIMYEPALTKGITVAAIDDTLTVNEALGRILAQTGIRADRVNDKTVVLKRVDATKVLAPSKTLRDDATLDSGSDESAIRPAEVVVSAEKKGEERLQDTPVPITVLNANSLGETGQVQLRDYFSSVPGLTVTPNIEGQQEVVIRGISLNNTPTVAVLLDDAPLQSATQGAARDLPDIDPGDLARIEVLKGPQGTLYGANAMGGLVRYITKDPSTDSFSGRVEAGTNDVRNGAEPGFDFRGSANIPVSDDFAVRASAFTRQDAGYINNVVQNIKGINEGEAYGGRVAGLWKPTEGFSLKFGAIYQNVRLDGIPEVNESNSAYYAFASGFPTSLAAKLFPSLGDLQQNYVAGADRTSSVTQVYSLILKDNLGVVDLSSNTGYSNLRTISPVDGTPYFGPTYIQQGYQGIGAPLITDAHLHKLTEEIRVSGGAGSSLEWTVGGFYARESEAPQYRQWIYETNLDSGQIYGTFLHDFTWDTYSERAGFGNLTYHFTDQFDVQAGARQSHVEESGSELTAGPYATIELGETPPVINSGSASSNAFTYLFTPEFKFSHDLMMYARLASGFRPGSFNAYPVPTIPKEFDPDKTYNYELGLKGEFFDHRLTVDTSLYYIDWRNVQITLRQGYYYYGANGSRAKSEGVEFSFSAELLTGLTVAGWADYDHAVLVENFPSNSTVYGVAGNQLPSAPEYSAQLSIQQSFPLFGKATGSLVASATYTGDRLGTFMSCAAPTATGACPVAPPRQDYPAYTRTDLRANVQYESWAWSLYANNIADVRGILSGGSPYFIPYAFNVIQPRTVGLTLVKTF